MKGAGTGQRFPVYTLKPPEKLRPQKDGVEGTETSSKFGHEMELNPMMLTVLGVVSGILIVIVLVAIAVKVCRNSEGGVCKIMFYTVCLLLGSRQAVSKTASQWRV